MKPTFEDAVRRLNSRNIDLLLKLAAYLSALDHFGDKSTIFPGWNSEKHRLFTEAIIASKAASYKSKLLNWNDFRFILNGVNDALHDRRIDHEIRSGDERGQTLFKLQRFLSRMANVQIRYQEYMMFVSLGRLIATLIVIPASKPEAFPLAERTRLPRFQDDLQTSLRARLPDLFMLHLLIYFKYQHVGREPFERLRKSGLLRPRGLESSIQRQWRILLALVAQLPKYAPALSFSLNLSQEVEEVLGAGTSEKYQELFGAEIVQHRRLLKDDPAYSLGEVGWRLSPLERYPLVAVHQPSDGWVVPNLGKIAGTSNSTHTWLRPSEDEPLSSMSKKRMRTNFSSHI